MPGYLPLAFLNLSLVLLAFIAGMYRFALLDTAAKIFCLLLALSFIAECLALYCTLRYHNNLTVLHLYSIVEVTIVCFYFNYSVRLFRGHKIGICLGILSFLLGVGDIILPGQLTHFGGFFMYYDGLVTIILGFTYIIEATALYPGADIFRQLHFWVAIVLIFFWSCTILEWTAYDAIIRAMPTFKLYFSYLLCALNYICYLVIALTFFRYPKMYKPHVR